jgi:hypothetical protein
MKRRGGILSRIRPLLKSQLGTIDLGAVIAGVIIIGVVGGGYFAATLAVIPWAQDNVAKQLLSSVVVGEGASLQQDHRYTDYATLLGTRIIAATGKVVVAVNAAGGCFAASSVSATGTTYYATDAAPTPTVAQPAALKNWTAGTPLYGHCEPTPEAPPVTIAPPAPSVANWQGAVKPANSQTKVLSVGVTVTSPGAYCLNVALTGTTTTAAPWAVTLDTTMPPMYGRTSTFWSSDSINFADETTPTFLINGKGSAPTQYNSWNNSWNNAWTSSAGVYKFAVCDSSVNAEPDRPEAYTATTAKSTLSGEWGGTTDCMETTVHGSGAYPFYAGWSKTVDVSAAIADFKARGVTTSYVSWNPNGSVGQTVTGNISGLGATSYFVTEGRDNAIMGSGTTLFDLCLHGY